MDKEKRDNFTKLICDKFPNEIWFCHPRISNYLVSSHGRIKSFHNGKILKVSPHKLTGYHSITLVENGIRKLHMVHRLVAESCLTFMDGRNYEVNHKDGNKSNNRLSNLEWVTRRENIDHAISIGKFKRPSGYESPCCKFDKIVVDNMKELRYKGMKLKDIALKYNTSMSYVCTLIKREV